MCTYYTVYVCMLLLCDVCVGGDDEEVGAGGGGGFPILCLPERDEDDGGTAGDDQGYQDREVLHLCPGEGPTGERRPPDHSWEEIWPRGT